MKIICRNNFAQCNARGGNELRDEISELRYDLLLVSRRRTLEEKYRPRHRSYENRPIIIIKKNNLCFAPLNPFCTTLPLSARDRFVRAHIIIRIPAIIVFLPPAPLPTVASNDLSAHRSVRYRAPLARDNFHDSASFHPLALPGSSPPLLLSRAV